MGVYELFTCSQQCTRSVAFWLSILHTLHLKLQTRSVPFFQYANIHNPEFR